MIHKYQWGFWYGYSNHFDLIHIGLEWRDAKHARLMLVLFGVMFAVTVRCPVWREKI